jgi:hypothetical protein
MRQVHTNITIVWVTMEVILFGLPWKEENTQKHPFFQLTRFVFPCHSLIKRTEHNTEAKKRNRKCNSP